MTKEYKKVRFSKSFRAEWISGVAEQEGISNDYAEAIYLHGEYKQSFIELEERIAGNIGFVYEDNGGDYFEMEDDDWSIPEGCFEYLDQE